MGLVGLVLRAVFVVVQTVCWSTLLLIGLAVQRLRKGAAALTPDQRKRPSCLNDPKYGTHQFATLDGVTIHYMEKGDKSRPLLLLIHGFPAFWYCWHYQLTDLSKDYWVVAVDLRGYGQSSKPAGRNHYSKEWVAEDMSRLVFSLGRQSCVVAGHDWGGIIAFQLTQARPSLVDKLIILNAPHPHAMSQLLKTSWDQLMRSWYIFVFQLPWLPEAMFSMDNLSLFKMMFHHDPSVVHHYPDELIEAFKFAFQAPGALTPPIDYYRQNLDPLVMFKAGEEAVPRLICPLLVIWGENDAALSPVLATMSARYVDRFRVRFLKNASHWVMMESPEEVNKLMRDFIEEEVQ